MPKNVHQNTRKCMKKADGATGSSCDMVTPRSVLMKQRFCLSGPSGAPGRPLGAGFGP